MVQGVAVAVDYACKPGVHVIGGEADALEVGGVLHADVVGHLEVCAGEVYLLVGGDARQCHHVVFALQQVGAGLAALALKCHWGNLQAIHTGVARVGHQQGVGAIGAAQHQAVGCNGAGVSLCLGCAAVE